MNYIGDIKILDLPKSAFLCSDKYSSKAVLACYDWTTEVKSKNICVVSGFQSKLEQDILNILLKGNSPIVLVLARGIYKKCPAKYFEAVKKGQLLIISPFTDNESIITRERARTRNELVISMADEIVIGHISAGGMIEQLLEDKKIPVKVLDN